MRERAAYLYRKVVQKGLLKGRSIDAMAAASIFLAARENHHPVTIDRLEGYSPVDASKIRHNVLVIRSELSVDVPPAHPRDFLPVIVSRLSLGVGVERRAAEFLEQTTAAEIHIGKHPAAIAATVVYAAANDSEQETTQQSVASAADVSVVTISRHYQDIREAISEENN